MATSFSLTASTRKALTDMAADFSRIFGSRFTALVAYAPTRAAAFATSLGADDLDALAVLAATWHRAGLDTPLVLTVDEFRRSLDSFALEYQAIIDQHETIAGTPPFEGLSVDRDELRRACEARAKGHLVQLRQSWIDAGGHSHDLAHELAASAMPLRVLLSNVATLEGRAGSDAAAIAGERFPADADVLRAVLALEVQPNDAAALVPRLPQYLAACERVWAHVDRWRAE